MVGRAELLLLTRTPESHGNRRLAEEAQAMGLGWRVLDSLVPFACCGHEGEGDESVAGTFTVEGRLEGLSHVIPRFGPELQAAGIAVLRQLELAGLRSLCSAEAFARARDKVAALQAFQAAGLPAPRTAVVSDAAQARAALRAVGGPPVVLKPARGWRGEGMVLARDEGAALAWLEERADARSPLLVQRFVAEASGRDLRILVAGGAVVAAIRRRAPAGEFRANAARGGEAEPAELTAELAALACSAVACLGLESGGVDVLESSRGPLLLEVNAAPGFEALERATGLNAARPLLRALLK